MAEKHIEGKIVEWAIDHGWVHLKLNVLGRRGWPDQLFIAPGPVVVFMEMKDKGKKPRAIQMYVMKMLHHLGCHVTWTDDVLGGVNYLDRLYTGKRIVGAAWVSATVLKQDDDTGSGGGVPKARPGENIYNAHSLSDFEAERARFKDAGDNSVEAGVSRLAGRDDEVEAPGFNPHDLTRQR